MVRPVDYHTLLRIAPGVHVSGLCWHSGNPGKGSISGLPSSKLQAVESRQPMNRAQTLKTKVSVRLSGSVSSLFKGTHRDAS